jgi:acetylornithine deacetylase/succinyl-diaminopimelate desuccinylase-like protein
MKFRLTAILSLLMMVGCVTPRPTPGTPAARDPEIAEMLVEIDSQHIRDSIEKLVSFKTRHTLSETESETEGIGAARRWIKSELQRYSQENGRRLLVEFHETSIDKPQERVPRPVKIVNVIATLPGTGSAREDRVYIVSGHYDSRALDVNDTTSAAPGANDDASGAAAVMEMARVMSRHTYDATIVFVCVAGEEQGLLGAAALAQRAKDEKWEVGAMLDNDIIGNTHGGNGVLDDRRVRVFSEGVPSSETAIQMQARQSVGGENDGPSRQLARYVKEVGEQYVPHFHVSMLNRRDRYGRGGDHIPFLRQGYPAVRFTEPNEDFSRQHQNVTTRKGKPYGDVPEFVDYDYVANVARMNAAVLASLASAPASPRGVTIDPDPSYDTRLSWLRDTNENVDGYCVLVRETTAPTWQRRIDVGKVYVTTIKGVNKDDYMFAVEAYDKAGHRSVPAYPSPRRRAATTAPATTTATTQP